MRRVVSAVAVLGVAASLVFASAPAHAIEVAPPPPVDEVAYKPSTLTSTTGTTEKSSEIRARLLAESRYRQQNPTTVPRPLAPPKAPTRGLSGGPLGYILLAPVLVNGALKIYVTSAEANTDLTPEQLSCATVGQLGSSIVDWLYSVPEDCGMAFIESNPDVSGSLGPVSYGGLSVTYTGKSLGYYYDVFCYSQSGTLASNLIAYVIDKAGSKSSWQGSAAFGNAPPPAGMCSTGTRFVQAYRAGGPNGYPDDPTVYIAALSAPDTVLAKMDMTVANPTRTPKCTVSGGGVSATADGIPYTETEGLPLGGEAMGCTQAMEDFVSAPGSPLFPEKIKIDSEQGGSITTIADMDVPAEAAPSTPEEAPAPTRGLVLTKVVDGVELSCMTWEADCADWWADSDEGTDPSTYRCTYQGATIPLAECGVYRRTFTSLDPDTGETVITDPVTGEDIGWGTAPDGRNSTDPSTGPTPGDRCMESWASVANPIDWVLTPVKCAFVWAFVPRSDRISDAQGRVGDLADETMLGTVGGALTGLASAFEAGVGCGGLPFHLEGPGWEVNAMLLASCDEPAAGIAATVRTILSGVIIAGGILAFIRYLGALFGFTAFGRNHSEPKSSGGPSFD